MPNQAAILEKAVSEKNKILCPYYLGFKALTRPQPAPQQSWKLKSPEGKILSVTGQLQNDTLEVKMNVNGEPLEHKIWRSFGEALTMKVKESSMQGETLIWKDGGLEVPIVWELKKSFGGVSQNGTPMTGPLKTQIKFDKFVGDNFELPEWTPLTKKPGTNFLYTISNEEVVRVNHKIQDTVSGVELADINMYFRLGSGIIKVTGRMIQETLNHSLLEFSE